MKMHPEDIIEKNRNSDLYRFDEELNRRNNNRTNLILGLVFAVFFIGMMAF